jgi:hypothetical protein
MTRLRLALAALAAAAAAALLAAPAGAAVLQLGLAPDKMKPGCPEPTTCRVITKTTAYQLRNNTRKAPVRVTRGGSIVALSLRLGNPSKKEIHAFNQTYGGTPRVGVAVLRPVKGETLHRKLVSQSPVVRVQPYFDGVSDFPLATPLKVRAGDYIGVTVPTWAPILAVGQPSTYSWRASRDHDKCGDDFLNDPTFLATGAEALFGCRYSTGRLTYSATEVTSPKPRFDSNQDPIKKGS